MDEQNVQNKYAGVFEKRWVRNTLIGAVIMLIAVIALRTALQTMVSNRSNSVMMTDTSNESLGFGRMENDSSIAGIGSSKSIPQNSAVAPMMSDSVIAPADKKVIKNGDLSLKVSSADNASRDIAEIARSNGGDIFSSNIFNQNNVKSGNIVIKIPVANFEKTFNEIKKVASVVVRESTTGQDVSEQYSDLQAQLKNRQAEEAQFQAILQQAQKIQDVLDVTQQLYRVRGEIEQLQGQIKYLDSQTDMSIINVSLSEDQNIVVTDSWRPWQVAKDAVNSLIKKAQGFVTFTIVLVITVLPTMFLYLLFAYVIFLIVRKIYRKIKGNA